MHKLIVFLICLPCLLSAQKSGKITYDMTIKVEIPDRVPKEFRDRIPKEQKLTKELYFSDQVSTYKTGEMEAADEANVEGGGRGRRFRMRFGGGGGQGQTYKDLTSNVMIDKRDLMGKDFRINSDVSKYEWKVTGQKKQILEYLAMEATTMANDTVAVSAWFTPQIPISNGPSIYQGLPGMILEMNIDNGREVLVASTVALGPIDDALIEKPSKGKVVTKEEFNEIRKEKMEEMREQRGGARGGFRVRRGE